jgi:predicted DNA-binding ribbon-helix-helix protein
VSLEAEFWEAFRDIAERRGMTFNALAAQIDEERELETGLATAIRLFVLTELRKEAGR